MTFEERLEYRKTKKGFIEHRSVQMVGKDYCLLIIRQKPFALNTSCITLSTSRETSDVFGISLFLFDEVFKGWNTGNSHNWICVPVIEGMKDEVIPWGLIKEKAKELLKDPNIKKQFLAHRLK